MTRHEIRKEIFKIVFGNEFHAQDDMANQVDIFVSERDHADEDQPIDGQMTPEDEDYIRTKSADIISRLPEIDEIINDKVDGWKTNRMGKVDLAIIRLALYEIIIEKLPVGVAINEAVSLADEFGTDNSSSFVNGALAKISKTI